MSGGKTAVVLAVALGAATLFGAARLFVALGPEEATPPPSPSLFPADARPRVERLRDRLAAGLLSLRTRDGDFATRQDGGDDHPMERVEASAFGVAGLAAARRMGSTVAGLDEALATAKQRLLRAKPARHKPQRTTQISALSLTIVGFSLARDPADADAIDIYGRTLVHQVTLGLPEQPWSQGVAARALAQLVEDGRAGLLGDDPVSAIPSRRVELGKRVSETHVAQALVEEIQRGLGAGPSELSPPVFERVLAERPRWAAEQTDLGSWLLEAWLAARRPDGAAWFEAVLPALEEGAGAGGVLAGWYSGHPVSRTASALLILWEGSGLRPARAP